LMAYMGPDRARFSWATRRGRFPKNLNGSALTAADLIPGASNLYDNYHGTYITPGEERWSVFCKGKPATD